MAISIKQLEFCYPGASEPVISIPNWQLQDNESVFIHGPSGCGKTTFLNLLSAMAPVTQGTINLFDHALHNMNARQRDQLRANLIGCVFQNLNLIPYLSPIENIKLASVFSKHTASNEKIYGLLEKLQLNNSMWHKPTEQLSMGQKQRVAIARALINDPKVIIADEPTSSLDENNRDAFITLLMEQVSQLNCALIFVSHDMAISQHFSRIESFKDINQGLTS